MTAILRSIGGEWTKFRSVRSTAVALAMLVGLTALLSLVSASTSNTNANDLATPIDRFSFTHQQLTGDGTLTARVDSLDSAHEWAKAGLIIKDGTTSGASYAAVMVTAEHGVRWQANFDTDVAGSQPGGPVWLRLSRRGDTVTGEQSDDGASWETVSSAVLSDLPDTAQIGLFASSPPELRFVKLSGASRQEQIATEATARFSEVALAPATGAGQWSHVDVTDQPGVVEAGAEVTDGVAGPAGTSTPVGRAGFELTGSGDVAGSGIPSWVAPGDDDLVVNSLSGATVGLVAAIVVGVLAATSEYRSGMIRTTLAVSTSRLRVLAAKATVVCAATFVAGLIAALAAFQLAQPALRSSGFEPPAYPHASLSQGPVFRAVFGTAIFLALLALLSLAVGVVMRRAAPAIASLIGLLVVPQIVAAAVPSLEVSNWILRLMPSAGLAIQQTRDRPDTAIGPWPGLAVTLGYVVVALGFAALALRRRDA